MRYRLQRVEAIYGHPLSDVRALVNLFLAVDAESGEDASRSEEL
jgi:hypothetical protein